VAWSLVGWVCVAGLLFTWSHMRDVWQRSQHGLRRHPKCRCGKPTLERRAKQVWVLSTKVMLASMHTIMPLRRAADVHPAFLLPQLRSHCLHIKQGRTRRHSTESIRAACINIARLSAFLNLSDKSLLTLLAGARARGKYVGNGGTFPLSASVQQYTILLGLPRGSIFPAHHHLPRGDAWCDNY
jgi:hypothetical protein